MAKIKGGRLLSVYGIFLALLTLFIGALFIMQVWSIYRSAPQSPYTVENIRKHFQEIAVPVWVWIGAVGIYCLLSLIFPKEEGRPKAKVDLQKSLARTKKRLPKGEEWLEEGCLIEQKQEKFRFVSGICCGVFMAAVFALCLAVLLDILYFPWLTKSLFGAHNGVGDRLLQVSVLSGWALAVACVVGGLRTRSYKQEQKEYLALIEKSKLPKQEQKEETFVAQAVEEAEIPKDGSRWKEVIRSIVGMLFLGENITQADITAEVEEVLAKSKPQVAVAVAEEEKPLKIEKKAPVLRKEKKRKKSSEKGKTKGVCIARVLLAIAGIALVVVGIFNGGMQDVLAKAINICTQCIGLG